MTTINTASGATFEPWHRPDGAVGFKITQANGRIGYIWLEVERTNVEEATALLYIGDTGRANTDACVTSISLDPQEIRQSAPVIRQSSRALSLLQQAQSDPDKEQ